MPIYEYNCPVHKVFEVLDFLHQDFRNCPSCGSVSDFIYSLVIMKPDKYWSGIITPSGKYVTSSSQYNLAMGQYEPQTKENIDYVIEQKRRIKQEKKIKANAKLESVLAEELASVEFDKNYSLVDNKPLNKQRKNYVRY